MFFGSPAPRISKAEMRGVLQHIEQSLNGNRRTSSIKIINRITPANTPKNMDTFNLYSEEEHQQQKNAYNSPDSLSPTPSPQPTHGHLQFTLNNTPSTQNQMMGQLSPLVKPARRGRRASEECKNVNRGHWSTQENKKYHWFLEIHYAHFVNRHMRRMDKIFKTMEIFVGTRQAEQCRSHHQKMEKKYYNFATIIANLRRMHYDSLMIEPIISEMEANGVATIEGLATIEYLQQQQSIDPTLFELKDRKKSTSSRIGRPEKEEPKVTISEVKEQACQMQGMEEEKWEEARENRVNMLEESHMNIGELSLYHEKEENSSIFNSIFL